MCLAVPGKVISLSQDELGWRQGKVSFGGVIKLVSLAYVPAVKVGDYVIVHAGFALSILEPQAAEETLEYLNQLTQMEKKNGNNQSY
ncbi:MAG: HypC/HybG/HupF family hydrogenase formation chaperone [Cyanobacteria bacterium J083]|nr:MAG: HypC/HybG/HupF family hydrogenase formation chaperone [Cyanobacteria bacterium J083]